MDGTKNNFHVIVKNVYIVDGKNAADFIVLHAKI